MAGRAGRIENPDGQYSAVFAALVRMRAAAGCRQLPPGASGLLATIFRARVQAGCRANVRQSTGEYGRSVERTGIYCQLECHVRLSEIHSQLVSRLFSLCRAEIRLATSDRFRRRWPVLGGRDRIGCKEHKDRPQQPDPAGLRPSTVDDFILLKSDSVYTTANSIPHLDIYNN